MFETDVGLFDIEYACVNCLPDSLYQLCKKCQAKKCWFKHTWNLQKDLHGQVFETDIGLFDIEYACVNCLPDSLYQLCEKRQAKKCWFKHKRIACIIKRDI